MNKLFKYISTAFLAVTLVASSAFAQINTASPTGTYTVFTNFTTLGSAVLLTNPTKIASIQIMTATNVVVQLYDSETGTNLTNAAYVTRLEYLTNWITTNISPLTGTTNIQTNSQLYEATVTNAAATNQLPYKSYAALANTLATYPVNVLCSKGVLVYVPVGCTVGITYRPND